MFCDAKPIDIGTLFVSFAVLMLTLYMAFLATWPSIRRKRRSRRVLMFHRG